jgi:hypothetical protein
MADRILLGTRKGLITIEKRASGWSARPPVHGGIPVSYAARDPRTGVWWAALDHGHWGPKLSRSDDGEKWEEPPQITYPEGARLIDGYETLDGESVPNFPGAAGERQVRPKFKDARLLRIWCLAFGADSQPGRLFAGTMPGGLFVSEDGGESWELNRPLWSHDSRGGDLFESDGNGTTHWFGGGATVNGEWQPGIHSILVDPRDTRRWLIAVSCAGVLETTDDGRSWRGRNSGLLATFLPDPSTEWGHDAHLITLCPASPDHLWQQNHCGIFHSENGGESWRSVSEADRTPHFGFPIAADEKDGRTAWVVPAHSDEQRMAGGSLCVARTQDGGGNWEILREGLPQENAYDIVYRHALDVSGGRLAFGSTTGNVYLSEDRGESWRCLGANFPPVYSVRFA